MGYELIRVCSAAVLYASNSAISRYGGIYAFGPTGLQNYSMRQLSLSQRYQCCTSLLVDNHTHTHSTTSGKLIMNP